VVYAIYATPPAGFYPVFVLCLLLVPLAPVIAATAVGMFIAWASSHFKRKSGANIIFTIAALLLWIYFSTNMTNIAENFAGIGEALVQTLNSIYLPAAWYSAAVLQLNIPMFALFAAVSAGAFMLFVAVISKNFKRINSTLTIDRTTSDFKMTSLKQLSKESALFRREWKRFSSSSSYVMNAGFGAIMVIAFAVLMLVLGADTVLGFLNISGIGNAIVDVTPFGLAFFIVINCPSASSISLEGKNLWIVKTMPVGSKSILMAKLKVALYLNVFAVLVSSTLISIALSPKLPQTFMIYATPLAYAVFTSLFGLRLNLSKPKFDWNNEQEALKRSMPVLVVTLSGMGMTLLPALAVAVFSVTAGYLVTAAIAVICVLLYRNIFTKGIRDFDALIA